MAMISDQSELIESSDYFTIVVLKNDNMIFYQDYRTFAQADEAFTRLMSEVRHQLIQGITDWTDSLYKTWKNNDPQYENVKSFIEKIWTGTRFLGRPIDKLYKGDVWNNINACLRAKFLTPLQSDDPDLPYATVLKRFYVDSLTFNLNRRNTYIFKLESNVFSKDVDNPRHWMARVKIKCK